MLTARAAYPYVDRQLATAGLRGQLRIMAAAGGGTPDWSTLSVEGPDRATGLHGRILFEWTASVTVVGGRDLTRDPLDEDDPSRLSGSDAEAEHTAAMPRATLAESSGEGRPLRPLGRRRQRFGS